MELNREQIIKALECCENEFCDACDNCPSPPNTSGNCVVFVMRDALALIKELTEENEMRSTIIQLLERDIADRDKMLESKVEEVYAEFMRDYKCMKEELEGMYEELAELRLERDELKRELEQYKKLAPIGCPKCHRGCFSNDKFCPHCGEKLKGVEHDEC